MLAPLTHSPRTATLAAAAAGVAPFWCRTNPFMPGNVIEAAGPVNGILVGASVNRFTALKYAKVIVAGADVTPAANTVGQTAAARVGTTKVTGDLTIQFGTAVDDIINEIADCADVTDADLNLTTIVVVNGRPYGRINDAAAPAPAAFQWGSDSDNGYTIVIGADATDYIPVGAEIEVFIGQNIGKCAERDSAGVLIAGTALAASVPEERYLGVISTYTDTAGRSVTGLVASDFVMAETAIVSMVGVTL